MTRLCHISGIRLQIYRVNTYKIKGDLRNISNTGDTVVNQY